jgi:phosphoenolpyruvate phosphomutase
MKAIILASGIGSRLMPATKKTPKTLIKIDGDISILERLILSFKENGIKKIIITTGPFDYKIKKLVKDKFKGLNIIFINNPLYNKTNYIYSFWLAKDLINRDDVILVHGDLVYDFKLAKKIIKENNSCVLVKKRTKDLSEKDFKARIKNGLITKIGVNIFGDNARDCMPLYKIKNKDFYLWINKIDNFIKKSNVLCYAEDALNEVLDDLKMHPVYYSDEICFEIDDKEDLKMVKKSLKFFEQK